MLLFSENKGRDSYTTLEESGGRPSRGPMLDSFFLFSFLQHAIRAALFRIRRDVTSMGNQLLDKWFLSSKNQMHMHPRWGKNASVRCKTLGAHLHLIFSDVPSLVFCWRPRAGHDRKMLALNSQAASRLGNNESLASSGTTPHTQPAQRGIREGIPKRTFVETRSQRCIPSKINSSNPRKTLHVGESVGVF